MGLRILRLFRLLGRASILAQQGRRINRHVFLSLHELQETKWRLRGPQISKEYHPLFPVLFFWLLLYHIRGSEEGLF